MEKDRLSRLSVFSALELRSSNSPLSCPPKVLLFGVIFVLSCVLTPASTPSELCVGIASHAFDHLGNIGDQAEAAAASGANIIYVTGLGSLGYLGLPAPEVVVQQTTATQNYLQNARRKGISLALGYVCATSLVKLDEFNKNWPPEFRKMFSQPPSEWRQKDQNGKPLPSWYGGDYQPACMNNPDWRTYERQIVALQLKAGCDGIFFDNPTVHPKGCYCEHCMDKFESFCIGEKLLSRSFFRSREIHLEFLRHFAIENPGSFLRFRCTIGRDFLEDMRHYARTIKPRALITANNSLNSAEVLFSQARTYGYNIWELSKTEDLVVVEDMSSQARILKNGKFLEYTPTYKQLHAISHDKPIVAVTLAEADYHTPPHLVRLAMAEAAANDASYLSWPTWPEEQRPRMSSLIRPQADFLRHNADLFHNSRPRHDALLFLPFQKWLVTNRCEASNIARELCRANVQFEVISRLTRDHKIFSKTSMPAEWRDARVLVLESLSELDRQQLEVVNWFKSQGGSIITTATNRSWIKECQSVIGAPSVILHDAPGVRVIVRDQPGRTVVHLLNLNVQRISSFEDKVTPIENLRLNLRVPLKKVRKVRALTADRSPECEPLQFDSSSTSPGSMIQTTVPHLEISALLVIE